MGADPVMVQLANDTPLCGSDYQEVHRDAMPLFPEWDRERPPFQLAVNFPLVDVTPENGPFEVARGTHMRPRAEASRLLESGALRLEPVTLRVRRRRGGRGARPVSWRHVGAVTAGNAEHG